jgi:hypothetical protein
MEGGQATQRHPLEDQIEYLSEAEKDEVLLINYRFGEIAGVLNSAPPKVRFDLYRHLCGQFHARRDLLTGEEVAHYINTATSEARRVIPPQPQPVIDSGEVKTLAPKPVDQTPADVTPSLLDQSVQQHKDPSTSKPVSGAAPHVSLTSGQAGLEILQALASSRRSTLLIGDTGAGKSVTQAYILNKLFELHPDAEVFVLAQKADSFCGLADKGRVTLFDPTEPEQALILISNIWRIYDQRRRLPEQERSALPPVRLILADWLSINQSLEELKNDESVKASRYLSKLADIIYNGRELNVCLLVDLQSYNLAAVGLKADRNSRKNFNLIGLGNYSVDELGMVNESYGVLTNLIGDRYIVAEESERSALNATFKQLQPISKHHRRPILFSSLSPARLALLPDLRNFKTSKVTTAKEPESLGDIRQRLELLLDSSTPEPNLEPDSSAVQNPEPPKRNPEPLNQPIDKGCADLDDGSPFSSEPLSKRFTPLNLTKDQVLALIESLNSFLNQTQIIERLWQVRKGGSEAWKKAHAEFKQLTEGEKF